MLLCKSDSKREVRLLSSGIVRGGKQDRDRERFLDRNCQLQENTSLGTTDSATVMIKRLLQITHPTNVNKTVPLQLKKYIFLFFCY